MNGEKFSSPDLKTTYNEQVLKPAAELYDELASKKAVIAAAFGALEAEDTLAHYEDMFVEAESIDAGIQEILQELLNENVAYSFVDHHRESLLKAKADAKRYDELYRMAIQALLDNGYAQLQEGEGDQVVDLQALLTTDLPVALEETVIEKPAEVSVSEPESVPESLAAVPDTVLVEAEEQTPSVEEVAATPLQESLEPELVPAVSAAQEAALLAPVPPATEKAPVSLRDRYKMADSKVLWTHSEEKGKDVYKKMGDIVGEIQSALREEGFSEDRIALFVNEKIKPLRTDIANLNEVKKTVADKRERNRLYRDIQMKYQAILGETAAFFQTEKVDEAEGMTDLELPQASHEDVDEKLTSLLSEYESIKDTIQDVELKTRLENLVEVITRYKEADAVRQILDKTKYTEKLSEYLAEARQVGLTEMQGDVPTAATAPVAEPGAKSVSDAEQLPAVINVVSDEKNPALKSEYEAVRDGYIKVKEEYKEKEKAYKAALASYYQDDSLRAKLRSSADSARKLFGFKAELPEHLQLLQNEYKQIRAAYAGSLDEVLLARSKREGNKAYASDTNSTKAAFGSKFILNPQQELLSLQERSLLTPEQQAVKQRVLQFIVKHKWAARAGIVAGAGLLGAASGGVTMAFTAAGIQAGRMGIAFAAGAGAGLAVNKFTKEGVAAARTGFTQAEQNVTSYFSLNDLDALEKSLENARFIKDGAERFQKVATIGSAVLAGGLAGGGFRSGAEAATSGISYTNTPAEIVVEPSSGALSAEAIARQVAAERASAPVAAVPEAAVAEVAEAVTTMPVMITEITAPYERLDNTKLSYETVASDVKIVGEFTNQTLSPAERAEVSEYLKQNAQRLMYAHANISESKLEAELFEKLQGKYGTSSWWGEAKVSAVDIGGLVVRPIAAAAEAVASAATQAPIEIMEESVAGGARVTLGDSSYTEAASRTSDIYTVQKGDTLYGIAEKQFAAELKHLSPIERGQILDSLFDKVEQYPELKESLGLKSGDVDKIEPDEKLNLSGLEAELEVLLERREIIEQFKNSAPLPVEADSEVKNVPITIVEKPVVGGTAVTVEGGTYTEAKPVVTESASNVSKQPEVIPPPRPFALNGQYAEQPAYKEYIQQVFGSTKAYEQAVERAVQNFDNSTYSVLDRSSIFGGVTYNSPYTHLGSMSLQQVTEFEQRPNEEVRAILEQKNIKYENYLAWLDKIDEMVQVLPNEAETKVSDLFSRYVVEFEKPKGNSLIK